MKASSLLHATDQCECCFTFIPFPAIGTPPYILLPTYPLTLPTYLPTYLHLLTYLPKHEGFEPETFHFPSLELC